jgi:hypothetical protein
MVRRLVLAALVAGLLAAAPTVVLAAHPTGPHKRSYERARRAVVAVAGRRAPGRDVVRHGLSTGKPLTDRTLLTLTGRLRAWAKPVPVSPPASPPRAAQSGYSSPSPSTSSGGGGGTAACIRRKESGGNYSYNDGTYAGAYNFDKQTWHAAGGSGVASDASPAEQDARFHAWFASHPEAWPTRVGC